MFISFVPEMYHLGSPALEVDPLLMMSISSRGLCKSLYIPCLD